MDPNVTVLPASGSRIYGNGAANIHDGLTPDGGVVGWTCPTLLIGSYESD